MILLDTSVLSLAFRRQRGVEAEPTVVRVLRQMVLEDIPLTVPGIVLQELLSGVRSTGQFSRLERLVEGFPILLAERAHHVAAARIFNVCRRKGISPSAIDCLIAALAISSEAPLLTVDEDFQKMASHCHLRLLEIREPYGV